MICMTLIEFYDKAKAITTAHGFGDNSLAVSATINDYAATKELAFQYQCAVFVPNCVVTGTHDSPEKALAKLDLICKEANIAKMEGGTEVDGIDAPIVDNAAPVGDIEATKQESEDGQRQYRKALDAMGRGLGAKKESLEESEVENA